MLARVLSVTIVLFWITMTVLLVRNEVWPDSSRLRTVPVGHLAKLMWLHQQESDLTIWNDGQRAGHLKLTPKIREEDDARVLGYVGYLQLRLPGGQRQRVSWEGSAEFDRTFALQTLSIILRVREPSSEPSKMSVELHLSVAEKLARYRQFDGDQPVHEEDFTLDEAGLRKVLDVLGVDPAVFAAMRGSSATPPEVIAQQSSMGIRGERIDTYMLGLKQSGQTLIEAHVSQLGRVLNVKTLVGYKLVPEDLEP